jgi:hypothetical protein
MWKVLIVAAIALGVNALVVIGGGDSTILVPSPEGVAEQFARELATRRYDRALQYVGPDSGITLTTVRLQGEALRRRGRAVDHVEGEPGFIRGSNATARAVVVTAAAGRVRYAFRFTRLNGTWKIVAWEEER